MGVTRRRFLVGFGALAAAAGGGAVVGTRVPAGRRLLHGVGLLVDDDLRPESRTPLAADLGELASGRRYRITRTGVSGRAGVPAVICLHGRNQSEAFAFDEVPVPAFAQVAGLDIVVAGLDGGPSSYWHPRASGDDPLADLVEHLVPLVDARSGGGPLTIMGWSMGGYGALLAAERRPDLFSAVVAASPAVWRRASDASEGAFDNAADFAAHDVLASLDRLPPRVRIDCGKDDAFADISRELLRRIPGAQGRVRAGFHDSKFWRTLVPEQLAFITASG